MSREITAVATEDATFLFLMYAFSPGPRGPLPRGISREEIERAYGGWTILDEEAFDLTGAPDFCRKHILAFTAFAADDRDVGMAVG